VSLSQDKDGPVLYEETASASFGWSVSSRALAAGT